MTAFTLGEAVVLGLGAVRPRATACNEAPHAAVRAPRRRPHITGAPVRRDSIEAGTFEAHFFSPPAKGETDRLLRMARAALDTGRRLRREARGRAGEGGRTLSATERAIAALTAGAVRVYEEICTLARLNAGRVFPSYDRLAAATALGRATIARSLHLLEAAGFLVRQRRFRRVEGEGPGPRYEQTSNAYRPTLPQRLLGHLPPRFRSAPLPDDAAQHVTDQAEDLAAMRATLSCRELAQATVGGALGRVLAKLGASLDRIACESHKNPEPLSKSFEKGLNGVGLDGQHQPA